MKTTYLINSIQPDGSTALVETSAEHWREITENNKLLSKSDRRYFITDIISESGAFDCMIMEVTYAEYLCRTSPCPGPSKKNTVYPFS